MTHEIPWRRRLPAIGAGVSAFALFHILALFPGVTEAMYGRGIGPLTASGLSRLTGLVPLSVAELLIVAFVARQLWGVVLGVTQARDGERGWGNAIVSGVLRLGADAGIVVALFYLLWGFNYARLPLDQRQQWNGREADVEEVARLAAEMVDAANFEYATLTGSDDLGRPLEAILNPSEITEKLDDGWTQAAEILALSGAPVFGFGKPKSLIGSRLLDHGLTSGFYFPWTAEANFNRGTPPVSLPHVIAHEMSHQRGFAREDEANFAGYLAASKASDPYPRYSAYVFAQGQLLSTLARHDRERARALAERRLPGVQRDLDAARQYWAQFEGATSRAARRVNNAYLRRNRVPDGILSYGRSVVLLIAYARSRGGWLVR